ncbi:MAG: sterol desaturase family protein [Betaproteobacteria bacterium]|nr:sterol desaturase family protein [Betaproteobacteria bacterium]
MADFLPAAEGPIRLLAFFAALVALAAAETLLPRRQRTVPRLTRWPHNLALTAINAIAVRALFPAAAVGVALFSETAGLGLLRVHEVPFAVALVLSVVLLDLVVYFQHVLFHAVPALWRLHRVHHADLDFDVTTGFRFHPIEIMLSMLIKSAAIIALGAPAAAVLLFEILLSTASLFNHANLRLPVSLDRALRVILVTPDMHRVHHSILPAEANSNFGFTVPWWDRLFGTYRADPITGHEGMTLGVEQFRSPRELALHRMLLQPFRAESGEVASPGRSEPAR